MSQYKMRPQRRRRQNYAPYRTRKQEEGLVSRVWSWLTPSSWWAARPPSPSPSPPPSPPSPDNHHPPPGTSSSPQKAAMVTEPQKAAMVTEPQGLLVTTDVDQGQELVNGMEPGEEEEEEDTSWVAEDSDPVGVVSGHGQTAAEHVVQREENPVFRLAPSHSFSPSLFQTRVNPGPAAMRSRPLLTSTPQLSPVNEQGLSRHGNQPTNPPTRSCVAQPRLKSIPEQSPFHSAKPTFQNSFSSSRAVDSSHRKYTDLSLSRSPFQSPFYSGRTSYGGAASGQRLRSVKRARRETSPPVLAPVQVTVRARPHPSAPPLSSRPTPALTSSTAQRILQTLDSLSSPLTEARRMPVRGPRHSPSTQPAKKRHKSAQSVLSPPPVASLPTPSLKPTSLSRTPANSGPVLVPNEKSLRTAVSTSRDSSLLGATLRPWNNMSGQRSSQEPTTPQPAGDGVVAVSHSPSRLPSAAATVVPVSQPLSFSAGPSPPSLSLRPTLPAAVRPTLPAAIRPTLPAASSSLASLTFSPPPLPVSAESPAHSSPSRLESRQQPKFSPKFHSTHLSPLATSGAQPSPLATIGTQPSPLATIGTQPSPLATSGGKMKARTSQTHYSYHHDNQHEENTPVAMVPAVGLKMKGDKPLSIGFMQGIQTSMATTALAMSTQTPPSFQFSTPKAVSAVSAVSSGQTTTAELAFHFSNPTPAKPHPQAEQSAEPEPLPLKKESVVDILKRADYQALTSGSSLLPTLSQPTSHSLSQTASHSTTPAAFSQSLTLSAAPLSASLSLPLSSSGDTSLPSTTVAMVNSESQSISASQDPFATTSSPDRSSEKLAKPALNLLSQFAPVAGSWECSDCLIQNKPDCSKCVACGANKPGGVASGIPATGTAMQGGLQLGLGGSVSLGPSVSPLKPLPEFAAPAGSWSCDTCLVDNKKTDSTCVACGAAKPGSSGKQAPPTTAPMVFGAGGGLKLSGGLALGSGAQTQSSLGIGGGGFKLGAGGLKFGDSGGLKVGDSGGLKLVSGSLNFGNSDGLKVGDSGGLKLGDEGGLKLGQGGLNFGGSGGLKFAGFGSQSSVEQPMKSGSLPTDTGTATSGTNKPLAFAAAPETAKPLLASAGATETAKPSFMFASTAETTKPLVFAAATETSKSSFVLASTTETTKPSLVFTGGAVATQPLVGAMETTKPSLMFSSTMDTAKPSLSFAGAAETTKPFMFAAATGTTNPALSAAMETAKPVPVLAGATKPLLSFAGAMETAKPVAGGLESGPSSTTGLLGLQFGAKQSGQSPSSNQTANLTTPSFQVTQQTSQSGLTSSGHLSLTFGQQTSQSSQTGSTPSFIFGQPTSQSGLTGSTPSFAFSQQTSQSGLTGSTPSLTFGQKTTQSSQTGSFGQQSGLTSSIPSFTFGQQTSQSGLTGSTPSFAFGQPASQTGSTPLTFGQPTGSTPSLTFGQQTSQSGMTGSAPSFAFGQQSSQSGPTPSLTFGTQSGSTSSLGFGQQTSSAPSFAFGQQPSQSGLTGSTTSFIFGQPSGQSGVTASAAPTAFGQQTSQSGLTSSTAFTMGRAPPTSGQSMRGGDRVIRRARRRK